MTSMNIQTYNKQSPESVRTVQERRRSNASGTHDSRPKRRRQRGQDKRAAIRESE